MNGARPNFFRDWIGRGLVSGELFEGPWANVGTPDDLARLDPALARLVEMRFFGGMTEDEIAEVVDTLKSGWITTGPMVRRWARLASSGTTPPKPSGSRQFSSLWSMAPTGMWGWLRARFIMVGW